MNMLNITRTTVTGLFPEKLTKELSLGDISDCSAICHQDQGMVEKAKLNF